MDDKSKVIALEKELDQLKTNFNKFVYIVTHDLKEPVRGMRNYANFTLEDFASTADPEIIENMNNLVEQGNRFDVLIEGISELSKVSAKDIERKEVDIFELLDGIVKSYFADEKLQCAILGAGKVQGDRVLITTMFDHILNNALLYNESEVKEIKIEITEKNSSTIVKISDNGLGIDEKYLNLVFDLFYRVYGKNKFGFRAGVGLSIVQEIMRIHNGNISIIPQDIGVCVELRFN